MNEESSFHRRADGKHALTDNVHVFSGSVFCIGPCAFDAISASQIWKKKAEDGMKSNRCKNSNDFACKYCSVSHSRKNRNHIARPSVEIEWHLCPGETSVHILPNIKALMSETRHKPAHFLDRIIFASVFNDITSCERDEKCKQNV